MRTYDRFTGRHLASMVAKSTEEPFAVLVFRCQGRLDPHDLLTESESKEQLVWAEQQIPRDEMGRALWLEMSAFSHEPPPASNLKVSLAVDGELLHESVDVGTDNKGNMRWPVLVSFITALREGSTLRLRLETDQAARRTYVFSVAGFARAHRWLEEACPIRERPE